MEHVRVGEKNVGMIAPYFGSLMRSGVPVVHRGAEDALVLPGVERFEKDIESFQLISAQRLDREKIERPLFRVLEQRFRDGQVVDEGLPARSR